MRLDAVFAELLAVAELGRPGAGGGVWSEQSTVDEALAVSDTDISS